MVYVSRNREAGLLVPPRGALTLAPRRSSLSLSLVLPTYNERQSLPTLLAQLTPLLDRLLPNDYELIVADDDSPDRTWQLALELAPQYPQLRVLRRRRERGLASAVVRGWQVARGEVLGVMDADLQHPPTVLPELLQAIEGGADLAIASRHAERSRSQDWPRLRQWLSQGAYWLGWLLLPQAISRATDPLSGYFLVRREALTDCLLAPVGYKILLEVLSRGRIQAVREVGYNFGRRRAGRSKVTQRHYWEYLQHLLSLRGRTVTRRRKSSTGLL